MFTLPPTIMVQWKMGLSNMSILSFRAIFHFITSMIMGERGNQWFKGVIPVKHIMLICGDSSKIHQVKISPKLRHKKNSALYYTKKDLEKKIIFSIILLLLYHPFKKENLTALTKGSRVATATKTNAWWKQRLFGFSWWSSGWLEGCRLDGAHVHQI